MSRRGRVLGGGLVLALVLLPLAVRQGWIELPPRWNPWAPLDVREPPNLLTSFKLMRLQADPQLCKQALDSAGMRYQAVPDSVPAPGCPVDNAVRVSASGVRFSSSFLATCEVAVGWALFERHGL